MVKPSEKKGHQNHAGNNSSDMTTGHCLNHRGRAVKILPSELKSEKG